MQTQQAQHYVHKQTAIKCFQWTEDFRAYLLTEVVSGQEAEPVEILYDGIKTDAVFDPQTQTVTVPKSSDKSQKLAIGSWFIYQQDGSPSHTIMTEERFHKLYEPAKPA